MQHLYLWWSFSHCGLVKCWDINKTKHFVPEFWKVDLPPRYNLLRARAAGYIGYVRYIDIISTGIQDLTISFISICVKMVSFPLKRLQRLPWRLWARPLPLPLCLSERACAKTPHSRPLTTQQAWMIPVKKTRRRRETKLFQRGETTAP